MKRSDTSSASGASDLSTAVTGQGITARYPPVHGILAAGTDIRTTPDGITTEAARGPGTTRNTSWPAAQYSAPSRSTAVRSPPERGP